MALRDFAVIRLRRPISSSAPHGLFPTDRPAPAAARANAASTMPVTIGCNIPGFMFILLG
jgi:hypothetical protein